MKPRAPLRSRRNLAKERYLEKLYDLVREYYKLGKTDNDAKTQAESHLNGYLLAGTESRLADADELQLILEELHHDEFGISIEEAKTQKMLGVTAPDDWSPFEEPTFMRYNQDRVVRRKR